MPLNDFIAYLRTGLTKVERKSILDDIDAKINEMKAYNELMQEAIERVRNHKTPEWYFNL